MARALLGWFHPMLVKVISWYWRRWSRSSSCNDGVGFIWMVSFFRDIILLIKLFSCVSCNTTRINRNTPNRRNTVIVDVKTEQFVIGCTVWNWVAVIGDWSLNLSFFYLGLGNSQVRISLRVYFILYEIVRRAAFIHKSSETICVLVFSLLTC